jgi:sRNA-binding regulator protein Hfq
MRQISHLGGVFNALEVARTGYSKAKNITIFLLNGMIKMDGRVLDVRRSKGLLRDLK